MSPRHSPGPPPAASLRALVAVAAAGLDAAAGPDRLLSVVVAQVSAVLGDPCLIWLAAEGAPTTASNHPWPVAAELARRYGSTSPAPGPAVLTAGTPSGDWLGRYGLSHCAVLPVALDERRLGTLATTRPADHPGYTEADLTLLATFADLTAVVAEQARMLTDSLAALDEMRRLTDIADHISDALISCDPAGQIVSWNRGAQNIYGYEQSEALGCDLFALLDTQFSAEDGGEQNREDVRAALIEQGRWAGELRERRSDGAPLTVTSSISQMTDAAGRPSGLVVVSRDITDQRHEEHQAMHDPLTGLPNRRMLNTQLFDSFARACRNQTTLAVLFIDLDGFKPINDAYGHAVGDQVLVAIGQRLSAVLRGADVAGRLGGDEFLVILEEAGNLGSVEAVARRVADAVAVPIRLSGGPADLTVTVAPSIGVAIAEQPDATRTNAAVLLEAADQAMYEAKRSRRGIAIAPPL